MLSPWKEVKTSIRSFLNPIALPPLIITAGGKSSRMGYPKGLLKHQGRHLIMSLLDVYRRAGGKRAFIILGHEIDKYFLELSFLKNLTPPCEVSLGSLTLSVVINKTPENGQFSSIKTGIEALNDQIDNGVFYHSVDRPPPKISSWHKIIELTPEHLDRAIFYEKDNIKAQPVWISPNVAKLILSEDVLNGRLDSFMDKFGYAIPCNDDFSHMNINTQEDWDNAKNNFDLPSPIVFEIKGKKRSGKTTCVRNLIEELTKKGFKVGGILQPSLDNNFDSSGYDVENILTKERMPLARRRPTPSNNGLWFDFYDDAFDFAKNTIIEARKTCDVLIVDEMGKLEKKGLGHAKSLSYEISSEACLMHILSIRE